MSDTRLADWLRRLEGLHPSEIDMGLARVTEVAARLDVLQPAPLVFTVTGTNGKGSTCAALDQLLRQSGRRSGCYSSPHLLHYNERISIDGAPVSDADLIDAFSTIDQIRGDISLTYFEFSTLAALWLFTRAGLDAVVLEVGLGGRLDAVNVVDADVAVITSIALDHADYLGDSRDSVAFEKAGIMRTNKPVVCSETDLPPRFVQQVNTLGATLLQRRVDYDWAADGDSWSLTGLDAKQTTRHISLPPVRLPKDNLCTALQAFWAAGLDMPDQDIVTALADTFVPGRLDQRRVNWCGQPRSLCLDVGHNPQAAAYLAADMASRPGQRVAVFGLLSDKNLGGITAELRGCFDHWAVAPLPSPRSHTTQELAAGLEAAGERVSQHATMGEAIVRQLSETPVGTEIVIFGSFFCVAEAILWLNNQTGGEK